MPCSARRCGSAHRLPLPPRPDDPDDRDAALAYLGITHSHPDWLVARWLDRYGFDAAERWVRFNNEPPPLTLRANRAARRRASSCSDRSRADGIETEPTPLRAGRPRRHRRQSAAAAARRLVRRPGRSVAARAARRRRAARRARARSLRVARRQDDGDGGRHGRRAASLVACDVRARRMRLLRDTVRASGAQHVRVVQVPASGPLPFAADRSIACSSMRPARASAPSGAIPTSAGGARGATCRAWRSRQVRAARRAPRPSSRRAAVWSTPPARASRRRTSASSSAFLDGHPSSRSSTCAASRRDLAAAARRPRHAANAAVRARARGVLRRGAWCVATG